MPGELPPPGEQPEDPAAAEQAVRATWDAMYGDPASMTPEQQASLVDDARGLDEGLAHIRERYSADEIAGTTIEIDEVVFASPEQAFVEYTVDAGPLGSFPGRFGELVLIDGQWKLTRHTVCSLLGLAAYQCPLVDG